MNAQNKLIIFN